MMPNPLTPVSGASQGHVSFDLPATVLLPWKVTIHCRKHGPRTNPANARDFHLTVYGPGVDEVLAHVGALLFTRGPLHGSPSDYIGFHHSLRPYALPDADVYEALLSIELDFTPSYLRGRP